MPRTVVRATVPGPGGPVARLRDRLEQSGGVVRRVIRQTQARVRGGNTHYPDKVLSLFEPHTEAIRKGKATKLTEFGKLVKIQEAEAQFITDYEVCSTRVPDRTRWEPSLVRHAQLFGHPPRLAVADAAFASHRNDQVAARSAVRGVAAATPGSPRAARSS